MPRITEISDKFFNRDDDGQTLVDFTSNILAKYEDSEAIDFNLPVVGDFVINGQDVYQLLADRGTGVIYDGMKSLEAMSRIIKGVGVSSVTLFDNKILAFTADDMRNASMELAAVIVNSNLGIKDLHSYVKATNPDDVASYDRFVEIIARQIRAGAFKAEDHLAEALRRVQTLAKIALNSKVAK